MDREIHIAIGAGAFIFYQWIVESINHTTNYPRIFGIIVAILGSTLPDYFEPATSWRHWGFCHGWGALTFLSISFAVTALIVFFAQPFPKLVWIYFVSCFLLGYTFPLLADSLTRMGLPG